jgi:hypothetical protein
MSTNVVIEVHDAVEALEHIPKLFNCPDLPGDVYKAWAAELCAFEPVAILAALRHLARHWSPQTGQRHPRLADIFALLKREAGPSDDEAQAWSNLCAAAATGEIGAADSELLRLVGGERFLGRLALVLARRQPGELAQARTRAIRQWRERGTMERVAESHRLTDSAESRRRLGRLLETFTGQATAATPTMDPTEQKRRLAEWQPDGSAS